MTPRKPGKPRKPAPSSRRVEVRLELTPVAKAIADAVAGQFGMTQVANLSRLFEWLAGQPEEVREAILSEYPAPASPELVRQILGPMANRD